MQSEEEIASSTTMMDPWSIFLYGMKAPMTREKYRGRLVKFFDFVDLTDTSTMEERVKAFTERGKKDPDWVFVGVLRFAQAQKERVKNGEIRPAPVLVSLRLLCNISWRQCGSYSCSSLPSRHSSDN